MKEDFSCKLECTIEPSIFNNGNIELTTRDIVGRMTKDILNTKEEMVRQALIQLGWLPPEESFKLLDCLSDIQQACIGEIAMGYDLDAEYIGRKISEVTGKTAPELLEYLRERE